MLACLHTHDLYTPAPRAQLKIKTIIAAGAFEAHKLLVRTYVVVVSIQWTVFFPYMSELHGSESLHIATPLNPSLERPISYPWIGLGSLPSRYMPSTFLLITASFLKCPSSVRTMAWFSSKGGKGQQWVDALFIIGGYWICLLHKSCTTYRYTARSTLL